MLHMQHFYFHQMQVRTGREVDIEVGTEVREMIDET